MFERKGIIIISNEYDEEKIMEIAIENGAEDFSINDDSYEIITDQNDFVNVKKALDNIVGEYLVSEITYIPSNEIETDNNTKEKVQRLIDILEDDDDVQDVYHNMKE